MIVLDYRDRRPLYEQVTEKLEELMFSGRRCAVWQRSFPLIPILYREPTQN